MKAQQKGFGVIGIVIIIVVVGVIGFVGWRLVATRRPADTANDLPLQATEKNAQQSTESASLKTYTDTTWKYSFTYPANWVTVSRDLVNGGKNTREVTIQSPNFKSNTASVVEEVKSGAIMSVSASDTDLTDFSATGIPSSQSYRTATVSNIAGVYYVGRGTTYTYAVIKNKVMYDISLRTVEGDKSSEATYQPIFEKLVASFTVK